MSDVIAAEAAALTLLSTSPPPDLPAACAILKDATAQGLVVATGLGKSGFVAARLAATLCSIGIPSSFLHPVEAHHGDSGLLWAAHALVCISNSGDTDEIVSLALHTTPIPTIAICRTPSRLASACDILLALPDLPEACAPDLPIPNVSIALQSAICDALIAGTAAIVPEAARYFRMCHPGGALGQSMQ